MVAFPKNPGMGTIAGNVGWEWELGVGAGNEGMGDGHEGMGDGHVGMGKGSGKREWGNRGIGTGNVGMWAGNEGRELGMWEWDQESWECGNGKREWGLRMWERGNGSWACGNGILGMGIAGTGIPGMRFPILGLALAFWTTAGNLGKAKSQPRDSRLREDQESQMLRAIPRKFPFPLPPAAPGSSSLPPASVSCWEKGESLGSSRREDRDLSLGKELEFCAVSPWSRSWKEHLCRNLGTWREFQVFFPLEGIELKGNRSINQSINQSGADTRGVFWLSRSRSGWDSSDPPGFQSCSRHGILIFPPLPIPRDPPTMWNYWKKKIKFKGF